MSIIRLTFIATLAIAAANSQPIHSSTNKINRIVNGGLVQPGAIPWQVLLYNRRANGWTFCSGALLTTNIVLTQASCVRGAIEIQAYLGSVIFGQGDRIAGIRYLFHPQYNSIKKYSAYNLGLLRLAEPVEISNDIQTINLPPTSFEYFTFDNQIGRVAGFGSNNPSAPNHQLRFSDFRIEPNNVCRRVYPPPVHAQHLILCTEPNTNVHPGYGDNGAPLIWNNNNENYVIGLLAFIQNSTDLSDGSPGYINVAGHTRWLTRMIQSRSKTRNEWIQI